MANRAASADREGADAARVAAARLLAARGEMLVVRLHGLSDQVGLLRQVAGASEALSRGDDDRKQLEELTKSVEALAQEARAAYEKAVETLGTVREKSAQQAITSLSGRLSQAVAALGGGTGGTGGAGGADAAGGTGSAGGTEMPLTLPGGAPRDAGSAPNASHEALIGLIASGDIRAAQYMHARTPLGRAAVDLAQATLPALQAIEARFGPLDVGAWQGQFGVAAAGNAVPRLVSATDDTAVYRLQGETGPALELTLRRLSSGWSIDYDPLVRALMPAEGGGGPGGVNVLAVTQAQARLVAEQMPDFTRRISGGEFATAKEATDELMKIFQSAAASAAAGVAGGGARSGAGG
jgi:hypothetical protein